jgi:hypothetical protein
MKKVERWLEEVYMKGIERDNDAIALVIGNEGVGKSTFMLAVEWLWQQVRNEQPTVEYVLDQMAHDNRSEFRKLLLNSDRGDAIVANDAAHILHRKETMHGDQIDIEKALLDIRTFNYFILLGYQDWADVTDQLQRRRASFAFRIPRRGVVHGYSRSSLDEVYDTGNWPSPDLKSHFPNFEGTEVWEKFKEEDEERKKERLRVDDSPDADDVHRQEQIKVVLRAVKPWNPDLGMKQKDAAKLCDYSETWVSNRLGEWEDGYHRELIPDDELEAGKQAVAK